MAILTYFIVALTINLVHGKVNDIPLPTIDLNEWWGPGNGTGNEDTSIRKFTVKFTSAMIKDLKYRLQSHREFTPALYDTAFIYGFDSKVLLRWTKYMAEEYPYKKREKFLNQYPQYQTTIQGLVIHFIRVRTQNVTNKTIVPLLILHGWPGSVREFYETIPYLLSYAEAKGFALDIIIPSLPGFGFSTGASRPGMGVDKVAVVCRNLMHRLGHLKYVVQGGDVGALVGSNMATFFPYEVIGYHTNFPFLHTPEILFHFMLGSYHPDEVAKPEVQSRIYPLTTTITNLIGAIGYMHIQATKPDTVGIGLADSPSGLIAYMMEKIAAGVRGKFIYYPDGGLTEILTAEQLFDNFMIYWANNCMTTAMRIYAETLNKRYYGMRIHEIRTPVPMWIIQAPDEIIYIPPWLLKLKFPNFLNETLPSEGGHFYAWEKPQHFAEDVVNAIVAFRNWHTMNSTFYSKCSSYISY